MSMVFDAFLYLNVFLASFRIRPVKRFIHSDLNRCCVFIFFDA